MCTCLRALSDTHAWQPYVCRPFHVCCRRPKGSGVCVRVGGRWWRSRRDGAPRKSPFVLCSSEKEVHPHVLSPIVRMSAEQPRLGSSGSDQKATRVDRSALHEGVARSWTLLPLAMEFFRPSSVDCPWSLPRHQQSTRREDGVRYGGPKLCGCKADCGRKVGAPSAPSAAKSGIAIPTLLQQGPGMQATTCRGQGLPGR
jgi:hypothetical protein